MLALLLCEDHPKWKHFPSRVEALVGQSVQVYRCFDGEFPPVLPARTIVSGSHYSVHDGFPWIQRLYETLRGAARRPDVRVVGLCFGCQAMACALGGSVGRREGGFRYGVERVTLGERGLLWRGAQSPPPLPPHATLHLPTSHGEVVTRLPPSALSLASSEGAAHEIFQVGEHGNLLGVQCHPELVAEDLVQCIAPSLVANGKIDEREAARAAAALAEEAVAQDSARLGGALLAFLDGARQKAS